MSREILEEAGLEVTGLRLRGVITVDTGEAAGIGLFVFTAASGTRACRPSAEGTLAWVPLAEVRKLDAVEDVPVLLARLAAAGPEAPPFTGRYYYRGERLIVEFDAE